MEFILKRFNIRFDEHPGHLLLYNVFQYILSIFLQVLLVVGLLVIHGFSSAILFLIALIIPIHILCIALFGKGLFKLALYMYLISIHLTVWTLHWEQGLGAESILLFLHCFILILFSDRKALEKQMLCLTQALYGFCLMIWFTLYPVASQENQWFDLYFFILCSSHVYLSVYILYRIFELKLENSNRHHAELNVLKTEWMKAIDSAGKEIQFSSKSLSESSEILIQHTQQVSTRAGLVNQDAGQILTESNLVTEASQNTRHLFVSIVENVSKIDMTLSKLAENSKHASIETTIGTDLVLTIQNNLHDIQTSVKALSQSVKTVAREINQIDSSLNQINQQCSRSIEISEHARQKTNDAKLLTEDLLNVSSEITSFLFMIRKISSRTNLLALNASIEAVSAGEAGMGFAIIANEVKELSKQTIDSTHKIEKQVSTIKNTIQTYVDSITLIHDVIYEVSDIVKQIALEVNNQTNATGLISSSVSHESEEIANVNLKIDEIAKFSEHTFERIKTTSADVREIAESTQELALHSHQVSENIYSSSNQISHIANLSVEISKKIAEIFNRSALNRSASGENNAISRQINQTASELETIANHLQSMIEKYKT